MKKCSASLLLFALGGNLLFSPDAYSFSKKKLTVKIDGLKNQQGQICFSLFKNSRGFPDNASSAVQAQCVTLAQAPLVLTFQNLEIGSYAIAIFHDANGDGTLNRNLLGVPTEGFGFSQNPEILTGPPRFGDSAVLVTGINTTVQVELRYF